MDNANKLWPVEQLLDWINRSNSDFVNLSTSEYLVILAILKFADNKTWKAHPSVETIANLTLKEKKHVEDVLKKLLEKNILKMKIRYTKYGDRDSNEYTVYPDKIWLVGANSPLPNKAKGVGVKNPEVGVETPRGRGKSTPLTTITTHRTTKTKAFVPQEAKRPKLQEAKTYQPAPNGELPPDSLLADYIKDRRRGKK